MNEIKFRAWSAKQKHMAYQGTPDLESIGSFMFHWGDYPLMQFTGLLDKNGVEIYEGDIVKNDCQLIGVVEFKAPTFAVYFVNNHEIYQSWPDEGFERVDVIGNIHENPELLESK